MRILFFILIFFLVVNITFGQTNIDLGSCGYDALNQKRINSDPQYRQEIADFEKLVTQKRASKVNGRLTSPNVSFAFTKIYRIPVVVHVVHRGEPIGQGFNLSDDHIREILKQVNDNYRKIVNTNGFGEGVDTGVEFALAVRDPNGNLFNGINRIDMSGSASYMQFGTVDGGLTLSAADQSRASMFTKEKYLNIWIVSGDNGGNWVAYGGGGSVGLSAYTFNLHGVVTHEIGHEMSLDHTFAGETVNTDGSFNCPPVETDPYTQGDRSADTPRHTQFSQNCNATVQNPCYPGDATQVDDLYERNYMAYGRCGKGNFGMFSNDQTTRIRAKAELRRDYYLHNQLVPPVLPNVDFYAENQVSTDVNVPVKFFEKSAGIPNTYMSESEWPNIQFAWTFKNGSTVLTSSKQNPVMTFSVPGYYEVTLTITTPLGSKTSTKQQYLFVQSQSLTPVCSVDLVEGAYYHSLHVVKFNTIYKETRLDFSDIYLGLNATNNTIVKAGETYPLIINVRGELTSFQHVKAYIDYNDNGSFEDDELIFKGNSTTDLQYFSTNVAIPLNAVKSKLLTMRIIGYSGEGTNNCGRIGDPDVEDYGVLIRGDCTTDLVEFSANRSVGYAGSSIQFHDTRCVADQSFANLTSYNWTFSNGVTTYSSTEQHPIVTFLQLGVYDVTLAITTPLGTKTITKQNFIKITEGATSVCNTFTGSVNYYLYRNISKVVFNTINKETSIRSNEGYKDFRTTDYTVVKEGLTYPISINLRTSGGDLARYKVYIDYNDSGTFEDSELAASGTSTASSIVTLSQNITIPFASIKNRMLTMRVMTSVGDIESACSNISVPDVEDYGVIILSNCSTEKIDFESDKNLGCSNTTIKFIDRSCIPFNSNFNEYAYEWIFSSRGNRYTSSEQNPSITFLQSGVYNVTLNITTPSGIKTITKENYIKIAEAPIVLCTAITSTDLANSRNINRVIFNTIDKKTSTSVNEGYQDFRCANYTTVKAGQTYPLTISVSSTGSYLERFKVYIDYNNDATFSNSELIFEGKATQPSSIQSFVKNISIPTSFVKNTVLTMRVVGNSEDINSTCGSFKNADIEDYGVLIENNGTFEAVDFESNLLVGTVNSNVKFIDKSIFPYTTNFSSEAYTYQWTFASASKTYSSTDQDPLLLFDEVGVYNVTLSINTPNGIKTLTKENYLKIAEAPSVVCNTITSSNNGYSNRNINRVIFNTIDKKTSSSINEGYQDFRLTEVTRVVSGSTYPISVTTSSSTYALENFKVYIDYNNDGLFASTELVFEGVATANSSVETFTKDIIIPVNAVRNVFLTMRVIGDGKSITATCGSFENPDIEDYGIYIDDNCTTEVLDFVPDKLISCVNTTIKFSDNSCIPYSTNFSNYTYLWTITNGTITYTSTQRYPSITFAHTGLFTVTLTITTPLGTKNLMKENYIRITEPPVTVCVISPSSGTWGNRAISKVVFNTISNVTPTNINEVYRDFRCTDITSVYAGQTYPLSINIGTEGTDVATYKIYIDYNNNGTFESTELVFSGTSTSNPVVTLSQNITIPEDAVKNKLVTMRVMTAVRDFSTACSSLTVPDVEDYGLLILDYTAAPTAIVSQSFCVGKTIADLVVTGTTVKWYANAMWGNALAASTTLVTGTYYATQTLNNSESSRLAVAVVVSPQAVPTFLQVPAICSGASLGALPTTSLNGITGTWSPAVSNTATTEYTFTPNAGQCATTAKLTITVNPLVTPTFAAVPAKCSGASLVALPTTSLNGILGTWSPAVSNTATTEYTFTPTAGQCAATTTITITGILVDDLKPVLKVKSSYSIKLDTEGKATLNWEDLDEGSTDNCSIKEKLLSKSTFSCADLGTTKITFTAKDASGNTSNAEVTVTVVDELKPTLKVKSNYTIKLDVQGRAMLKWEDLDEGSVDNCGIKTRTLSKTEFSQTDEGDNKLTYTITDTNGNTNSIEVTVRVDIVLSASEQAREGKAVKAYPNPVNEYLYLEFTEGVSTSAIQGSSLVDASGKMLGEIRLEENGNGQLGFSTSAFKAGMYFLRLNTRDTLHLIKFTVIH